MMGQRLLILQDAEAYRRDCRGLEIVIRRSERFEKLGAIWAIRTRRAGRRWHTQFVSRVPKDLMRFINKPGYI